MSINSYRADNRIFNAAEFKADLKGKNQKIVLCGVGAHDQIGITERNIRSFIEIERTVFLCQMAR